MTLRTIGLVDYGAGNLTSVYRSLHRLGFRCRVSNTPVVFEQTDLLLMPGVGAFPSAMEALQRLELVQYLGDWVSKGKPLVGICLGMQLLADSSTEYGHTAGLGLIPGYVNAIEQSDWHIGWNALEVVNNDPIFKASGGQSFYFNHSYVFNSAPEHRVAVARLGSHPLTVAVRRENCVGMQFHPEKSQTAGTALLRNVIEGLCRD